jgi:hypothetical protein
VPLLYPPPYCLQCRQDFDRIEAEKTEQIAAEQSGVDWRYRKGELVIGKTKFVEVLLFWARNRMRSKIRFMFSKITARI